MHNRLYKFLNDNHTIYPFQFEFLQKYSTSFTLIILLKKSKKHLIKENMVVAFLLFYKKPYDTVDSNILTGTLKHGMRGVAYSWFESYLKGRKQHVSINGFNIKDLPFSYGIPYSSVLGPLLFLLYINDLHTAIKFCKVHCCADDKHLLHISNSIKCYCPFIFPFFIVDSAAEFHAN